MAAPERWAAFLAQIADRHAQVRAEAETNARETLLRSNYDPAPVSHAMMAAVDRLKELDRHVERQGRSHVRSGGLRSRPVRGRAPEGRRPRLRPAERTRGDGHARRANRRYHELLRAQAPHERLAQAMALSRSVRELAIAGIRARHPEADAGEIRLRLVVRLYGRKAALRLFGNVPAGAR